MTQFDYKKSRMRSARETVGRVLKVLIVLSAAIGTIISRIYFNRSLAEDASIAGFFSFVVLGLIDYLFDPDHEILLAIYRSAKILALIALCVAFTVGAVSLFSFNGVAAAHGDPKIRAAVDRHVLHIQASFFALLCTLVISSLYAFWKFKATRFAEGRIGLLKDLIIQVRQTISDRSILPQEQRDKAVQLCLSSLLAALELSPWQWLLRKLRFLRPSFCTCTVLLLEPDSSSKRFVITKAAYPKDATEAAMEVFRWIEKNYFPAFLNEERFQELVRLARGEKPRGWQNRFFNFKDRHKVASAVGWIGVKAETLLSHDASRCRVFDSSFVNDLEAAGFSKNRIGWARIRSFIGCPLASSDSDVRSVLFVTKSIVYGFVEEDREAVIAVSELINLALSATTTPSEASSAPAYASLA